MKKIKFLIILLMTFINLMGQTKCVFRNRYNECAKLENYSYVDDIEPNSSQDTIPIKIINYKHDVDYYMSYDGSYVISYYNNGNIKYIGRLIESGEDKVIDYSVIYSYDYYRSGYFIGNYYYPGYWSTNRSYGYKYVSFVNKKIGVWKYYHENGGLKTKIRYKNGKRVLIDNERVYDINGNRVIGSSKFHQILPLFFIIPTITIFIIKTQF